MTYQSTLVRDILFAIQSVAGNYRVSLHEPVFHGNEWEYVKECLDTAIVSSVGKFVDRFERELAEYTGAKYAVVVVNGTAALHIALLLAGVQRGDEVLVPALTFVAAANAVSHCGAQPHFVDSEERTFGIDPVRLRKYLAKYTDQHGGNCVNKLTGRVIRAIVPVHVFGQPGDFEGLIEVANEFNLVLVEDAAESIGSFYRGMHTGTFGLLSTMSFNGNKTITTGGGGAILTKDRELAIKAKHLTTTAKLPHAWEYRHDSVAFNYRMPNINAALGCAQLEKLPLLLDAKRKLLKAYIKAFADVKGVRLFIEPEESRSNYWLQSILLEEENAHYRDDILQATNDSGIMTRPAWVPMHQLLPYKNCPAMEMPVAESLANRLINIPSSPGIML